jgi:hypothetical protein
MVALDALPVITYTPSDVMFISCPSLTVYAVASEVSAVWARSLSVKSSEVVTSTVADMFSAVTDVPEADPCVPDPAVVDTEEDDSFAPVLLPVSAEPQAASEPANTIATMMDVNLLCI